MLVLAAAGCGEWAEFRPAKGLNDLPSVDDAYRVHDDMPECREIGYIVRGSSIDEVARTAASNGGTHYRILDDFGHETVETSSAGTYGRGYYGGHSSSAVAKHHRLTARVFRCK